MFLSTPVMALVVLAACQFASGQERAAAQNGAPGSYEGPTRIEAADQGWQAKQFPEWSEDDARAVIANSPWVTAATPVMDVVNPEARQRKDSGHLSGVRGLISRHGWSSAARDSQGDRPAAHSSVPAWTPAVTIRWESAAPVREAELKAHETNAPAVDEEHYGIAVYGLSRSVVANDSKRLAEEFKKHAAIKRAGKKDLNPSSVEILLRDEGPVIVYLFPKSDEITEADGRVSFEARIATAILSESFDLAAMKFHGKLEL